MALTSFDYKIVLRGFISSNTANPVENVFWYKADSGGGSAQDLALSFVASIVPAICTVVSDTINFELAEVINLVNLQDFTLASFGLNGDRIGGIQNRWDAWGFQYLRPIRGMNNGSKRFGPIAKGDYNAAVVAPGFAQVLDDLSDTLQAQLGGQASTNYDPCCVKTIKVANENGNGKFHYEPDSLYICNSVSYQKVSHQDSRGG